MMAGLVIENKEAIIFDAEHKQFDGPKGLFKIVVDACDQNTISSWHIEDKYGEISRNLGGDRCKSLDAVVGRVGMFAFDDAIQQLRWTSPRHVNRLTQENERLKEELKKFGSTAT
ncbi:MAG: hypothetical protein JXA41_11730 [Deltaproteobacteria bacterium]|nr:hypothetical protein [Deltaproteobacteria bacterium]